jgi:hypothetical protein
VGLQWRVRPRRNKCRETGFTEELHHDVAGRPLSEQVRDERRVTDHAKCVEMFLRVQVVELNRFAVAFCQAVAL